MATTGRPSDYKPDEHPAAARLLVGNGATLLDLAEHFGVSPSTIGEWKRVHPEFSAQIDLGRKDQTDKVERSLFERATGYTFPSEKIVVVSQGAGLPSVVERVDIKEHVPPDVTAQIHWLKNRRPEDWKDKQQLDISGNITIEKALELLNAAKKPDEQAG